MVAAAEPRPNEGWNECAERVVRGRAGERWRGPGWWLRAW